MTYYNRRLFLKVSAASFLGATGALSHLAAQPARAASSGGYKAMVGIFLKGGLDSLDVVLPYDTLSYNRFAALRPGLFSAHAATTPRARSNLLAMAPLNSADFGGRQFAFSPEVSPLAQMMAAGDAAIIGNVGPLLEPTDRIGVDTGRSALPPKLFSHNDQQSTWMALGTEGARQGWGGRFMDAHLGSLPKPAFAAMTASGADVFIQGEDARSFRIPDSLTGFDLDVVDQRWRSSGNHGEAARAKVSEFLFNMPGRGDNVFGRDVMELRERGLRNMREFTETVGDDSGVVTPFPDSKLGNRLRNIAVTISKQGAFGNSRQLFYAAQGGFDTHDSQPAELSGNIANVFASIKAFRDAMIATGQWDDVVVFTMSDFGRTLNDNGDGTDHGWGGHHFVFGGQVRGNRIYGEMPELDPLGDRMTEDRARLIPHVSVEQYAATLGTWFGLDQGELNRALPNLSRFDGRDLGFLGGSTV